MDNLTHTLFALTLARTGRLREALDEINKAVNLDPLNSAVHGARATILLYSGQVDQSLDEYQSVTRADPGYTRIYIPMSDALEMKGLIRDAIDACKHGSDLGGRENYALANLGRLYGLSGRRGEANALLAELIERVGRGECPRSQLAYIYLGLGDKDNAFECIDQAVDERDPEFAALKVAPEFEILRGDTRYSRLLVRMKL